MKKIIAALLVALASLPASASVTCTGKIKEVVKWSGTEDVSILLSDTGRHIKFNDKSSISLILTAYAAQKNVTIFMDYDDVNTCNEGWPHYRIHSGYLKVSG